MDLTKIIDEHTKTALEHAEQLQILAETVAGINAAHNERVRMMLLDSSSILSQVAQSLDDAERDEDGEKPSKIVPFNPNKD